MQPNAVGPSGKDTWPVAVVHCPCAESRPLVAEKLSSVSSDVAQLERASQHSGRWLLGRTWWVS